MRWLTPPVEGYSISQRFGENKARYAKLGLPMGHEGIDWATPVGTPIKAAATGQIVTLQRRANTAHPYGIHIRIAHEYAGEAWVTVYAHLSALADGLSVGDEVTKGQVIGYTGNTGNSTGPHLHFSVRRSGTIVDPEPYLMEAEAEAEEPG